MRKKKKKKLFGKKFEITYAGWALAACLMMLCFVPILGNTLGDETTYCEVLLDGEVIGAVADPAIVDQAFLNARAQVGREVEGLVLANVDCSFQQVSRLFGTTLKEEQLEEVIYNLLQEKIKTAKQKYDLVKVNEFTVYLANMDEVKELLTAALEPYDPDGLFEVNIVSDTSRELNAFTVEVTPKQELEDGDGLKALNFAEKVEICEAYVDADQVTPLQDAIEAVTKETEKNQTYEVQAGDTLSVIANSRGYYVDEVLALDEEIRQRTEEWIQKTR